MCFIIGDSTGRDRHFPVKRRPQVGIIILALVSILNLLEALVDITKITKRFCRLHPQTTSKILYAVPLYVKI